MADSLNNTNATATNELCNKQSLLTSSNHLVDTYMHACISVLECTYTCACHKIGTCILSPYNNVTENEISMRSILQVYSVSHSLHCSVPSCRSLPSNWMINTLSITLPGQPGDIWGVINLISITGVFLSPPNNWLINTSYISHKRGNQVMSGCYKPELVIYVVSSVVLFTYHHLTMSPQQRRRNLTSVV